MQILISLIQVTVALVTLALAAWVCSRAWKANQKRIEEATRSAAEAAEHAREREREWQRYHEDMQRIEEEREAREARMPSWHSRRRANRPQGEENFRARFVRDTMAAVRNDTISSREGANLIHQYDTNEATRLAMRSALNAGTVSAEEAFRGLTAAAESARGATERLDVTGLEYGPEPDQGIPDVEQLREAISNALAECRYEDVEARLQFIRSLNDNCAKFAVVVREPGIHFTFVCHAEPTGSGDAYIASVVAAIKRASPAWLAKSMLDNQGRAAYALLAERGVDASDPEDEFDEGNRVTAVAIRLYMHARPDDAGTAEAPAQPRQIMPNAKRKRSIDL